MQTSQIHFFEYRAPQDHSKTARVAWRVMVGIAAASILAAGLIPAVAHRSPAEFWIAQVAMHWDLLIPIYIVFLPYVGLAWWAQRELPRRCSLSLNDDELIHAIRLPWRLNTLFRTDWRLPLKEIEEAKLIQAFPFPSPLLPVYMQLRIRLKNGDLRTFRPAMWFVPGSGDRRELMPVSAELVGLLGSEHVSMQPKNLAYARATFAALPVMHALRAKGIKIRLPD